MLDLNRKARKAEDLSHHLPTTLWIPAQAGMTDRVEKGLLVIAFCSEMISQM